MRIFAAALNLFVFTSAVKLEEGRVPQFIKTSEGYKTITGEVAYIWDGCQAEKSVAKCMAGKLTGDLSVPKDVANNMTFTYDELLK